IAPMTAWDVGKTRTAKSEIRTPDPGSLRPPLPSERRLIARSASDDLPILVADELAEQPASLPILVADEPSADDVALPVLEEELVADRLPPFPVPWRHPIQCGMWIARTLFGLASLILLLAVAAAVPLVNFWVLGYLLDVEGRVARSGKIRASFPLLGLAPRFGSIVLGVWLCVLPLRLLARAATDAALIDPDGLVAAPWAIGLSAAKWLVGTHLCLALARGGALSCFIPFKGFVGFFLRTFLRIQSPLVLASRTLWILARCRDHDYWNRASTAIGQFLSGLNARPYYSAGWRGYLGTAAWLVIPSALYGSLHDPDKPAQVLVMLTGGVGLWLTLLWTPLLQARFAAENRVMAFGELGTARELFRRAPFAWLFAIVLTYLLALPMYLFKAVSPPQDAMWFVTILFVVSIFPAKVALGWAYGRSIRRTERAWWPWRCLCKIVLGVLVAIYVFILFFTPAIGEHGRRVLFEHHSLLLPVPF
ncbi:MAG: hypothetical protein ACKV2Q_26170, partial [Planctomycetaceae bacterium]